MPFLPFVLLLAWQAVGKAASFALGWATALYFGQVPGRQGRLLAVISLAAAAWVIVVVGFAAPLLIGAGAQAVGLVPSNFSVMPLHALGLSAAVVLTPPAIAAIALWAGFQEDRSLSRWIRMLPMSYAASASLGVAVLEMVVLTPFLAIERLRRKRVLLQIPLVLRGHAGDERLVDIARRALATMKIGRVDVEEATGPSSWPMRTVGLAAQHLLGAVIRGEPLHMCAEGVELFAYATTVAVLADAPLAYRARAALERELGLGDAYLTWSEESRELEDRLIELNDRVQRNGVEPDDLRRWLDEIQEQIDRASLNSEEWNVLYRLRLQLEARR